MRTVKRPPFAMAAAVVTLLCVLGAKVVDGFTLVLPNSTLVRAAAETLATNHSSEPAFTAGSRPQAAQRLAAQTLSLICPPARQTFAAEPEAMGKYLTGDYWLVGPVTLTATTPVAAGRHGFQVSPASVSAQPFDARAAAYNASFLPALPLVVAAGENLVKTVSDTSWTGSNPTYLINAAVVTVVSAPPPPNSYRPAYFRGGAAAAAASKHWTAADLNWSLVSRQSAAACDVHVFF